MPHLVRPPTNAAVFFQVAILTEQLEVVPVERYVRIVHVLRREFNLMMYLVASNDQTIRPASLTQAALAVSVGPLAFDPLPAPIEVPRESFSASIHQLPPRPHNVQMNRPPAAEELTAPAPAEKRSGAKENT